MPKKAAAAHSQATTSLTQPTRQAMLRPTEAPTINTRMVSTHKAAS